jgi:molybdopterin molybdotransferase
MLSLAEALTRVLADARPLPAERVGLADAAGRLLAVPVHATLTLPPWDNSAMDGYAVRGADVVGATPDAPVRLRVLETVAAGSRPRHVVGAGLATRIMTGAPLPDGADCVIRVEDTDAGTEAVEVRAARDVGRNVRARGEDIRAGDVALDAGTRLAGAQLALLAALGQTEVEVVRTPRVAILGSGDELVAADAAGRAYPEGKVVASNGLALAALVRADGGRPLELGVAPDRADAIAARAQAAEQCDLLVTTAGASVGAFDFTREALASLGMRLDFWRVRIRPGAQTGFGRLDGMGGLPWLGLPGNPASALVTYELFVRPLLRVLQGERRPHRVRVPVTLDEPVTTGGGATFFLRVRLTPRADGWHARLTGPQGSGLLTSMAGANALLVVPEGVASLPAGAPAYALPLGDDVLHAAEAAW